MGRVSRISDNTRSSHIKSAERVLVILAFLARRARPVPTMTIARECGLPRSSAYHLLSVMRARDFVTYYAEERAWGLGVAVFEIGSAYLRSEPLERLAPPPRRRRRPRPGRSADAPGGPRRRPPRQEEANDGPRRGGARAGARSAPARLHGDQAEREVGRRRDLPAHLERLRLPRLHPRLLQPHGRRLAARDPPANGPRLGRARDGERAPPAERRLDRALDRGSQYTSIKYTDIRGRS
jgi:hypothetical protein